MGLKVRAYCAGDSGQLPTPLLGARLQGRRADGDWQTLATNEAGLDALQGPSKERLIVYETQDAAQARQWLERSSVAVRCQTRDAHGGASNPAELALDYLEVRAKLTP